MKIKYFNKIHIIFFLFSFFIFWNCQPKNSTIESTQKNDSSLSFNYSTKTKNYVSAHRGGSGIKGYPENCIETFAHLQQKGIQLFEIDIARTKDKKLILMHDNSLQRTSTGRQDVNQIDLKTIKEYFLVDDFGQKTSYKIPTFTEALNWGKNQSIYFMVDMKKGIDYRQVISEIEQTKMQDQVVLVSYTVRQAIKLHQLAPEMLLSVAIRNERELNEMMDSGIPTNKMIAFTGTRRNNPSLFDKIHQKNMLVIFGTLGNLDKSTAARNGQLYRDLEKEGVDIFATDRALDVHQTINKN